MKRLIAIFLAAICVVTVFAGCGKKGDNGKRLNYNYDMTQYITLGDYKSIKVDAASDTFKNYYNSIYESEISAASLYVKKKEGVIAKGDIAVIEYEGRVNGKKFEGGTSTAETPLRIGSNSFIPGFEDALIGKEIGKETVIDVTFPDEYAAEELAGKPAEFTVKINYVNVLPELTDELAVKLGYENKAKYEEHLNEAATESSVYDSLLSLENMAVKSYPETEKGRYDQIYNNAVAYAEKQAELYNTENPDAKIDASTMLYKLTGMTPNDWSYYCEQNLAVEMLMYAVFDAENLSYTDDDYNAVLEEMAASNNKTVEEIKTDYEAWRLEANVVTETVLEHLTKLATAK